MEVRCKVCGLLKSAAELDRQRRCYACNSAYQRFRSDPGWGPPREIGGLKVINGRLVNTGPRRMVPSIPSGNWFRYIVRERLLRGLSRYPYAYAAYESKDLWVPDKTPPWSDAHLVPRDAYVLPPRQAIVLGVVDIPHEEPSEPTGYIGPWEPPGTST